MIMMVIDGDGGVDGDDYVCGGGDDDGDGDEEMIQGVFLHRASPEKLKYGKPMLGKSTLT